MMDITFRPADTRRAVPYETGQAHAVRTVAFSLLAVAMAVAFASLSFGADVARGREIYENHCQFCHTPKIHSREKSLPLTKNELRLMVDDWRRQINLPWTPEETEDVVEYLNQTRYKFAPD